jgi:hypothetical protein
VKKKATGTLALLFIMVVGQVVFAERAANSTREPSSVMSTNGQRYEMQIERSPRRRRVRRHQRRHVRKYVRRSWRRDSRARRTRRHGNMH